MSSTATRSPPRMATSSGFHSGDGGVGASVSYGGLPSYHSTARLDPLAEAYLKAHHYPPAQVARIRRVFLRRAHDEEDLDPMEIMEGLTMEGMDEDKAGFLLSLNRLPVRQKDGLVTSDDLRISPDIYRKSKEEVSQ
ncbi:hypothetical protein FRB97_006945 [Tulasnella sp. 331]|nr:hypothetical protein FRB97_006945 [Tulasnella sp. 331]